MLEKYVIGAQLVGNERDVLVKSVEATKNRLGWLSFGNFKASALDDFLGRYKGKGVSMVLPSSRIFVRLLKLPRVAEKRLRQIVRYEAEQQIPFPIQEVLWDYVTRAEDMNVELEVRMAAIKKEWVMERGLEDIAKKVRLRNLGEAGLPLYNSIEQANGDFFGVLNMDGEEDIDAHFYNRGKVIFSRSIPMGKEKFGEGVIRELQRSCGYIKSQSNFELLQLHQILVSGDIVKKDDCKKIIEEITKKMDVDASVLPTYSDRADYAIPIGAAITYLNNEEQINFLPHKEPIKWDVVGKNILLVAPRAIGYTLSGAGHIISELGDSLAGLGKERYSKG